MLLMILYFAGKSQNWCDCQSHSSTPTSSALWLNLFFQRGKKASWAAECLKPDFLQLSGIWLLRCPVNSSEFPPQPLQNWIAPSHPISKDHKFPVFLQQVTHEWLILGDFLVSSCSSCRKQLFCRGQFCHWSIFATWSLWVSLVAGRHARAASIRAQAWTEAFKKESSRLFLGCS